MHILVNLYGSTLWILFYDCKIGLPIIVEINKSSGSFKIKRQSNIEKRVKWWGVVGEPPESKLNSLVYLVSTWLPQFRCIHFLVIWGTILLTPISSSKLRGLAASPAASGRALLVSLGRLADLVRRWAQVPVLDFTDSFTKASLSSHPLLPCPAGLNTSPVAMGGEEKKHLLPWADAIDLTLKLVLEWTADLPLCWKRSFKRTYLKQVCDEKPGAHPMFAM